MKESVEERNCGREVLQPTSTQIPAFFKQFIFIESNTPDTCSQQHVGGRHEDIYVDIVRFH